MERALHNFEDLYNNAPVGYHSLDKDGVFVGINDTELSWLGYSREEVVNRFKFSDVIASEDVPMFQANFAAFMERGFVRDVEYLMRRKDGSRFAALLNATVVYDDSHRFLVSRGTVFDISRRKEMEEALRESEVRYRSVVDALSEGVILMDADGVIRASNASAERILGLTVDQIGGRVPLDPRWVVSQEDGTPFPPEERPAVAALRTGKSYRGVVMRVDMPDGKRRWVAVNSQPLVRNGEQKPYAVVASFTDITERKLLEHELERQARIDALTGAVNRRYFMVESDREIARARRFAHPLSLLLIDVDHFKSVNDQYGHEVGDQVLVHVVRACRQVLRDADILARIGGEEFAVVLPEADLSRAVHAADRIREAVAHASLPLEEGGVCRVTLSIGVTELRGSAASVEKLLRLADRGLYEAKEQGRNRVCVVQAHRAREHQH